MGKPSYSSPYYKGLHLNIHGTQSEMGITAAVNKDNLLGYDVFKNYEHKKDPRNDTHQWEDYNN
jgi:hypothetical protein